MADTKLVGAKRLGCDPKRGHHDEGCDCCFPEKFSSPPKVETIFVRANGSDKKGDGSKKCPFRTIQRATLEIPLDIDGGVYHTIDATGLIDGGPEILPPNYAFPSWKAPVTVAGVVPLAPSSAARGAVNLIADLRDVPDLGSDAVIVEGDLEATTDVGGPILTAQSPGPTDPILITTTSPHKLVESPFGIFGVFAGLVQVVEISGVVGNDDANGVFLALVTKPTVDESTTFELYNFNLEPVVNVGAGTGGTVTVLFVKDQFSGQVQVKVSDSRPSWIANGPDTLKGKILSDRFGDTSVIYANTDQILHLANNGGFDISEVRIQEPSCVLQCSDSQIFETEGALLIGGLNIVNVDSMVLSGIEVRAAPDGSGLFHSGGVCRLTKCVLEAPSFALQGVAFTESSRLIFPSYNGVIIDQNRCLVENMFGSIEVYWSAYHGSVIIQDESPLPNDGGGSIYGAIELAFGVKVISEANPVFLINGGNSVFLGGISIEGGSGDAIVIGTQGNNKLFNVGGSGWLGAALVVESGAQVEVNEFSFLKTDEMLVGVLPSRTFGEFRGTPVDGLPVQNQFDLVGQNAGANDQSTGARVFQR